MERLIWVKKLKKVKFGHKQKYSIFWQMYLDDCWNLHPPIGMRIYITIFLILAEHMYVRNVSIMTMYFNEIDRMAQDG